MKLERKKQALQNFTDFLNPILGWAVGKDEYKEGVAMVFEALQNPVINKQVNEVKLHRSKNRF